MGLEGHELLRIEAGRGLVHAFQRKLLDHLLTREILRPIVQRPPQQQQVVDQGVRQKTDFAVEIDDDRIERIVFHGQVDLRRDRFALLAQRGKVPVFTVLG